MLQAGRSQVRDPMKSLNFFLIYLILPAVLGPGVYSASNRNEYQRQKKMFLGSRAWPVRKARPHRHLRVDCLDNVGSSTSHNPIGLHSLLQEYLFSLLCL
jgi:hypothetical protein